MKERDRIFELSSQLERARSERSAQFAVATLREALRLMEQSYTSPERERRHLSPQEWYPFLNGNMQALAAAFDDEVCLALLESLSRRFRPEVDFSEFEHDREIVTRVKTYIATEPGVSLNDLRKKFTREERVRLRDIRWWMELRGDFAGEAARNVRTGEWARRQNSHRIRARPTFREKMSPVKPVPIDLTLSPPPLGEQRDRHMPDERHDRPFRMRAGHSEPLLLPREGRHPRKIATVVFEGANWLVGADWNSNALGFDLELKNAEGVTTGTRHIDSLGSFHTEPDADAAVIMDETLGITVLDKEATVHLEVGLWNNPDLNSAIKGMRGIKRAAMMRSVSVSVAKRLVCFSALDQVFVFTFDGEPVAAFRMPPEIKDRPWYDDDDDKRMSRVDARRLALIDEGLSPHLDVAQVASYLAAHRVWTGNDSNPTITHGYGPVPDLTPRQQLLSAIGEMKTQWVYYSRLTADGTGLWIGGYSGLLLRMRFDGTVEGSWWLPQAPTRLVEADGGAFGISGDNIFKIQVGKAPTVQHAKLAVVPHLITKRLILGGGNSDHYIYDPSGWTVTEHHAKGRTAIFPAGDGLVAESATSAFLWL